MNNYPDYKFDYITDIIETSGSLVHKDVISENIPGINYIIELIEQEKPTNKTIGLFIESYSNCKKGNEIIYNIPSDHLEYYSQNELSILFIIVDEDNGLAYWQYQELPQLKVISFRKELLFNLSTFNLDIIPFILNKKTLLSNISEKLIHNEYNELLSFFQLHFDYLEIALPYVLIYDNFELFCNSLDITYKLYNSDMEIISQNILKVCDSPNINIINMYEWWVKDNDILHISTFLIHHLNHLYNKLRNS